MENRARVGGFLNLIFQVVWLASVGKTSFIEDNQTTIFEKLVYFDFFYKFDL